MCLTKQWNAWEYIYPFGTALLGSRKAGRFFFFLALDVVGCLRNLGLVGFGAMVPCFSKF
ncbi:uncharacterized protein BDV14DRAFT_176773 [Aspergillus stella-maris]|uniref:uncharacterized protein n=1 Tax=Aspergillus stella-maris TaxID=1810926 RepID=UPI003CCDCB73